MKRRFFVLVLLLLTLPVTAASGDLDHAFRTAWQQDSDHFEISEPQSGESVNTKQKALLYSVLLPGLGQYHNGDRTKSKVFFGLEAAIWASFIVFKSQEALRTNDFEEYAGAFAEVDPGDYDEEFYRILTIYDDVGDYNTSVAIDARAIFGSEASESKSAYIAENSFGSDKNFRWSSNGHRLEYRLIRNDARDSGQRADFSIVAAVINRAISAVEATRSAGKLQALSRAASHLRVLPPEEGEPARLRFALRTTF